MLQQIKGQTARNDVADSHSAHMAHCVETLWQVFAEIEPNHGPDKEQRVKKEIDETIRLAFSLAIHLASQRCRMQFFTSVPGSTIQDRPGLFTNRDRGTSDIRPDSKVLLAVSPGLQRVGDSRGTFVSMEVETISAAEVFMSRG